jgi:hypothetical protein
MVLVGLLVWALLTVVTAVVFTALCRGGQQDELDELDEELAVLVGSLPQPPGRSSRAAG